MRVNQNLCRMQNHRCKTAEDERRWRLQREMWLGGESQGSIGLMTWLYQNMHGPIILICDTAGCCCNNLFISWYGNICGMKVHRSLWMKAEWESCGGVRDDFRRRLQFYSETLSSVSYPPGLKVDREGRKRGRTESVQRWSDQNYTLHYVALHLTTLLRLLNTLFIEVPAGVWLPVYGRSFTLTWAVISACVAEWMHD